MPKFGLSKDGEKCIDNICPLYGPLGPQRNLLKFSLGQGESRRGKGGWAEAVGMW